MFERFTAYNTHTHKCVSRGKAIGQVKFLIRNEVLGFLLRIVRKQTAVGKQFRIIAKEMD
jgi:hypothetical protein